MADQGRRDADAALEAIERRVRETYAQAQKEIREKMERHFLLFRSKDAAMRSQLARGIITESEYKSWRLGQMTTGTRWQQMLDAVSVDLVRYRDIAKSIANGYMPEVYAANINWATYDVERRLGIDTSFTLYSREAVEQVLRDEPELLPPPGPTMEGKIAKGERIRWHKGQIQSAATQAILQGESNPDLATRISDTLCAGDRKAAMRYARTATTGAENAGRIDAFHRLDRYGVKGGKSWAATLDGRTRHAHRELDGQTVPVDAPFVNSLGQILFPGDPNAAAGNIWNCRCGLIYQITGFETNLTDMNIRNTSKMSMTYEEWKQEAGKSRPILEPDRIAAIMRMRYASRYKA